MIFNPNSRFKDVMMIKADSTIEMIKFFGRYTPNYIVHLTDKNKITNFDAKLIFDFQTTRTNTDDFIGLDAIELIRKNKKYSYDFANTLSSIIKSNGTGLCAINTTLQDRDILDIPSIHILFIMIESEIIAGNNVKIIKIFNYIEIAKFLSNFSRKAMFCPLVSLTRLFQHTIKEKSLFFAFESLKEFGTFISSEIAAKYNQQQLADIVFPFHQTRSKGLNQRFVNEFLRSTGYIEYDKNRKIKDLSFETLERIKGRHLIPFNSLEKNCIIQLS